MQVEEMLPLFPIKEFHPFPRGLMGPGAHEIVGPEALKLGFKRTLVMTSGLRGSDIVHKITESLKYHGLEVVGLRQGGVQPQGLQRHGRGGLYQQNECDSFISIGGGSRTTPARARASRSRTTAATSTSSRASTSRRTRRTRRTSRSPPPAGTGSETSWAYVITDTTTDPDNPHKYVAFDDACVTSLAIDDPSLYYDCPWTTPHSAASTCSRTPASRTCRG
jgi:methanol:N,N-dimethyl-4-nitrosoaniline oxidoreductase